MATIHATFPSAIGSMWLVGIPARGSLSGRPHEINTMSAWRSLILLLALLAGGVAISHRSQAEASASKEVAADSPKPWGTMDGKSPFRLISDRD